MTESISHKFPPESNHRIIVVLFVSAAIHLLLILLGPATANNDPKKIATNISVSLVQQTETNDHAIDDEPAKEEAPPEAAPQEETVATVSDAVVEPPNQIVANDTEKQEDPIKPTDSQVIPLDQTEPVVAATPTLPPSPKIQQSISAMVATLNTHKARRQQPMAQAKPCTAQQRSSKIYTCNPTDKVKWQSRSGRFEGVFASAFQHLNVRQGTQAQYQRDVETLNKLSEQLNQLDLLSDELGTDPEFVTQERILLIQEVRSIESRYAAFNFLKLIPAKKIINTIKDLTDSD